MKRIIIVLIIFTIFSNIFSQETPNALQNNYKRTKLDSIAASFFDNGWIIFKTQLNINPESIFSKYKELFGLSNNDEMRLVKIEHNDNGSSHYKFQQYYKGIKVEGMRYAIHSKNGIAWSANGKILIGLDFNITYKDSGINVLEIVRRDETAKNLNISQTNNSKDIYKRLETLIAKKHPSDDLIPENFLIVKRALIKDTLRNSFLEVRINTSTKKVHSITDNRRGYDPPSYTCTAQTLYNGLQSFKTFYYGGQPIYFCFEKFYHMWDIGPGIPAYYIDFDQWWGGCPEPPRSKTTDWGTSYDHLTSAMFAFEKARQFYIDEYSYSGLDNADTPVKLIPSANYYELDTFYAGYNPDDNSILLTMHEIADLCHPVVSLDIIGHEYTHGVMQHVTEGGLSYNGETGAIEEGIADIFGGLIQTSVEGYNATNTYTLGEDVFIDESYIRVVSNPKSSGTHSISSGCDVWDSGQPDTYLGDNWDTRGCDFSGIHTNSTVMSYWFFLLAEGGSGTNDNNFNYNVTGIGRDAAQEIVWQMMDYYLNYGSNFSDARSGSLMAAMFEYGICSDEMIQVANAWDAVGVPSGYDITYDISCNDILDTHYDNLQYFGMTVNDVNLDCDLSFFSNTYTHIMTTGSIVLEPGFKIGNGAYFIGETFNCIE